MSLDSMALIAFASVSAINPFVYQAPPYNFSAAVNGLINISLLIGCFVGSFLCGWMVDRLSEWHARRHKGVFFPESRLPTLLVPLILVPAGLLMFAYQARDQLHWIIGYIGFAFLGLGLAGTSNIAMLYTMDSHYAIAEEALLIVNALKNVIAFGFLLVAVDWIQAAGYTTVYGVLAGVHTGVVGLAVVLYFFGSKIRHYTASNWKLIY